MEGANKPRGERTASQRPWKPTGPGRLLEKHTVPAPISGIWRKDARKIHQKETKRSGNQTRDG